jgi:hypothetical protein
MTWLWRCVESSRVESSRVGSAGWRDGERKGNGRGRGGVSYAERRVMSEMEVRISESDTASP